MRSPPTTAAKLVVIANDRDLLRTRRLFRAGGAAPEFEMSIVEPHGVPLNPPRNSPASAESLSRRVALILCRCGLLLLVRG